MTWRAPVHYVMDDEVSTGTLSYFRGVSGVDRVAGHRDRHAHTRSSHPREDASQHVRRCHRLGLAAVQGLTLVHFSAQLEPCVTQEKTLHTLNTPYHLLNTGCIAPTRTPYPIQSAQVELKSGRV